VAGFDGSMPEDIVVPIGGGGNGKINPDVASSVHTSEEDPFSPDLSVHKTPLPPAPALRQTSDGEAGIVENSANRKLARDVDRLLMSSSRVGVTESAYRGRNVQRNSQAQVFVGKKHGGKIYVDDPSFLSEWSVEAIALVRRHLFRAGNGKIPIPFETNWINDGTNRGNDNQTRKLPLWATEVLQHGSDGMNEDEMTRPSIRLSISDVPLLVAEVEELLDIMEGMMAIQQQRRLDRLRPPGWLQSNWYIIATVAPSLAWLIRRLSTKGYGKQAITFVLDKVSTFFRERVVDPVVAM